MAEVARQGLYSRANLAQIRVKKDIQELSTQRLQSQGCTTAIEFPHGTHNVLQINVNVSVSRGVYQGGNFWFRLDIPATYPFHAPAVTCLTRAWHPSIDLESGSVMLPILGKEWRPVLSINSVVFCLQLLFVEPNPDLALNQHAAQTLTADPVEFQDQVHQTLAGGTFFGLAFPRNRSSVETPGRSWLSFSSKRKSESLETMAQLTITDDPAGHGAMRDDDDENLAESNAATHPQGHPQGQSQPKRTCAYREPRHQCRTITQEATRSEATRSEAGELAGGRVSSDTTAGGGSLLTPRAFGLPAGAAAAPLTWGPAQPPISGASASLGDKAASGGETAPLPQPHFDARIMALHDGCQSPGFLAAVQSAGCSSAQADAQADARAGPPSAFSHPSNCPSFGHPVHQQSQPHQQHPFSSRPLSLQVAPPMWGGGMWGSPPPSSAW